MDKSVYYDRSSNTWHLNYNGVRYKLQAEGRKLAEHKASRIIASHLSPFRRMMLLRRSSRSGAPNGRLRDITGMQWWQINRLREQFSRRRDWLAARRFFNSLPPLATVWVWRYDYHGMRIKVKEIYKKELAGMSSSDLQGLRVARGKYDSVDHNALDACCRTRRPRYDARWIILKRPTTLNNYGSHRPNMPEVIR